MGQAKKIIHRLNGQRRIIFNIMKCQADAFRKGMLNLRNKHLPSLSIFFSHSKKIRCDLLKDWLIVVFFGLWAGAMQAQPGEILELTSLMVGEIKTAGFTLRSDKEISITAVGSGEKVGKSQSQNFMSDPNNMFAYPWILNAKTREMVWRMSLNNSSKENNSGFTRSFRGDVFLPAGEYEVYFSSQPPVFGFYDDGFFSLGRLFDKLFKGEDWYKQSERNWQIRISGIDEIVDKASVAKFHKALKDQAVVSLTDLRDSDFRQEGFKLTKPGNFEVYAIGEAFQGENYDYGWIVNAETSEKIWETQADKGEYAGGAQKNRQWRDSFKLDPGNYWIYFVMDDSHSPSDWNSNPPYDPNFYGLTISGIPGKFDPKSIQPLLKQKIEPIIELTRLGDDELIQSGFKLTSPMQIRIYAIGEGRRGRMFDYGWIIDLETGEKVWEMTYNRTRNAGGASKNRLIDEVITLAAGSYMVYFVTDDSHSYRRWNSAPPYNPSTWGISIFPADPKFSAENVQKLETASVAKNIIAQIIRVGNGRTYQERFEIRESSSVRLYALGEGDWDEMYDYGWIEEINSGRKVWQMNYNDTQWSGGAKKNRKFDQIIQLPAGRYILFYHTDDSHSFNDWNATPPDDPVFYGITIYKTASPQ